MVADGERFGWQWVVAGVTPEGDVLLWLSKPKHGRKRKR